ncbi:MAG: LytTR family transcriptional regulator DNA-binding domain-containing protein [Prevotella sp.]|nr:LytTR family transcriptional regulator DNA-binding domain-containing protein [Prevotella sp.]
MLRVILLSLSLCMGLAVHPQVESRLAFRRYTNQDGLPQMLTEKLFQDSRGYIYVGTQSGLVRFDGREFTPFLRGHHWNIVGFVETGGEVRALSFRQQWTIGYDEVERKPLTQEGGWLLNNFNATDLPNGYMLLEDEQEQHRWLAKAGKSLKKVTDDSLLDAMTPDRHLYVDSLRGVLIPQGDILGYHRSGPVLYAFARNGIYRVEGDSLALQTPYDDWQPDYGFIVRQTHDGTLLIADSHSLFTYDGTVVTKISGGFNLIKDMMVDKWNRLWVATYQGLYCFFGRQFTNHKLTDGDDIVRAVAVAPKENGADNTVLGTLNGKIISGGSVLYDNPDDFFVPSAAVIYNNVYMAGGSDVACISGDSLRWLGMPFGRYQFVAEASGRLILGMRQLIAAYDPATGHVDTLTTEVPHPWCAAQDGDGRLWVGSTFGLFSVSSPHGGPYITNKVAFGGQQLIVTAMDADGQGTVYFASCDSLFAIRHGQVEELNSQMPLLSGHEVRSLHASPGGLLTVALVDGLIVARLDSTGHVGKQRFYDHHNGFTLLEPLKADMAEGPEGTVWLCGIEKMTSFNPAKLLEYDEEDTYIASPPRWYEHWWVWLCALLLVGAVAWAVARWYYQRQSHRKMLRLRREKLQREQQIEAIRQKAKEDATTELAKDIVKMTEREEEEKLTFRTASGTLVVAPEEIVFFKGDGNYSHLVTFHNKDTVLMGLGAIEKLLDSDTFVRADRSTLVNIRHISSLLPRQRRCVFRSPDGKEVETTLLAPAFKRLQPLLP